MVEGLSTEDVVRLYGSANAKQTEMFMKLLTIAHGDFDLVVEAIRKCEDPNQPGVSDLTRIIPYIKEHRDGTACTD